MKYLWLLLLTVCSTVPNHTITIIAPPSYKLWYEEIERCSGLTGNFNTLIFQTQDSIIKIGDDKFFGYYFNGINTIVLVTALKDNKGLVQHEEMHSLLPPNAGHPDLYFKQVCGDLFDLTRL